MNMLLSTWIHLVKDSYDLDNKKKYFYKNIAETIKFNGEGQYNLNVLKEITVTNDFLGLDQDDRKCQNEEPLTNCTTRQYLDTLLGECGCFPVNIGLSQKVIIL